MHLHVARVRRNGKLYEYVQLVESYRRSDGMPTQRVVAKLGSMTPLAIENLRVALKANKQDRSVVVDSRTVGRGARPSRPKQSLRYLDLAVLRQLWCDLGLRSLLEELMPRGESDVAPADVVAALVIQRCVEPGSKLYAERWFPRTALPELLGIVPAVFNNTRLHRVLDELESITERLMTRLPELYEPHRGGVRALLLDMTDTWFVGHGPEIAERAKTKEGIVSRKVGIVLLCTEDGFPLRWQVVAGKAAEPDAMGSLLDSVAGLPWVRSTPMVMDRAMGTSTELGGMLRLGVHFVTALRTNEYAAYTNRIPYQGLVDLSIADEAEAAREAARRVATEGLQRVSDTLYVLDLGVVERDGVVEPPALDTEVGSDAAAKAMAIARQLQQMVESAETPSFAGAARRIGISLQKAKWHRMLTSLAPDIQTRILSGEASAVSITKLRGVARLKDHEQQRAALDRLVATAPQRKIHPPKRRRAPERAAPVRVRALVTFNPERFVQQRRSAREALDRVQAQVAALNAKLAQPKSRRTQQSVEREIEDMLRQRSMLEVYEVVVEQCSTNDGSNYLRVRVTLDAAAWQRRRNHDGFSILVTHPEVNRTAPDIARLYRAKDAVEKDFQVIKSFVQLRPVWHRTNAKVRAHVTICMLSLLLERVLARRLRSQKTSARTALELLNSCTLNRFDNGLYVLTEPDLDQRRLLRALHLEPLIHDAEIAARIRPRETEVASTPNP